MDTVNSNRTEIHVLATCISPPNALRGDTRIILECMKRWTKNEAIDIYIYTTEEGYQTFVHHNVQHTAKFIVWPGEVGSLTDIPAHLSLTRQACRRAGKIAPPPRSGRALLYSASSFWPDVLPGVVVKQNTPRMPWIGSAYLVFPSPLKGFEHAYNNKYRFPAFDTITASFFYQQLTLYLIRRKADKCLITNIWDRRQVQLPPERTFAVYGGIDLDLLSVNRSYRTKEFDGCFVGRLHPQKGLIELIHIWAHVCQERPAAQLAVIGKGNEHYERTLKEEARKLHLENNIHWLGFMDGGEKVKVLRRSRVFLHPAIYDNSGMAACEAMAVGIPAVSFDLPPLRIAYPKGMLKAPIGDIAGFARRVLQLLADAELYKKTRQDAIELSAQWDWDIKAEQILHFLLT
jgi:glycosyltransferase involved in cell wall biosynthesis